MSRGSTAVIIGGGVIGASIAWALTKRGIACTVIDKGAFCAEASTASAGMLCPQAEMLDNVEHLRMFAKSQAMHRPWTEELEEISRISVHYIQEGTYRVVFTEEEERTARAALAHAPPSVEWISATEVLRDEPDISGDIRGAISFPEDGQLHPVYLAKALKAALSRVGCKLVEWTPALGLLMDHGRVSGARTVARALAWYGDKAATPVLLEEITRHLGGDVLPVRDSNIRHTQASPDQGAMPDLAYLLHTLAMVKDERAIPVLRAIVDKIDSTLERFHDNRSGIFHYVDSVCEIAEGIGSAACIPALERLHRMPLFHGHVCTLMVQPDFFEERLAYLEITIARALARCGCRHGLNVLVHYLSDRRHTLVRYAHHELVDITGQTIGEDEATWRTYVQAMREVPVRPWQTPRGAS
ncbi:FAD-binding oxidoreductase [Alicyclobacillus fastidiosus]|uniref:FAD-binding oxidoreductase n=1 Tax=Alicyclobacillus fastidiosus TaxID=392011 RepID=A0ABY6ZAQ4_9BACL|nr:FAD-dependent oxidoreductase [Alicyclobacillus fastidiosus]WAH39968.1 FAD-binding oxidoreductase [Alicyclobacillus fastidiosus]GMA61250.1 hypothetical protein GCM10025859_16900 [Alicyclobacillus fastidiosus]